MQQTHKTLFSDSWKLIKPDIIKVLKGFIIAVIGGVITFLQVDFIDGLKIALVEHIRPEYMALIIGLMTAINSSVINFLRKLIGKNTYIDKK